MCVGVCVRTYVRSLPHTCRHVGPEIHTVFVDALPFTSSTREREPWSVVEEIVACRHYRREHNGVSEHRHDIGLYGTCVLEHHCQLLIMQCDCHDGHALTAYGVSAAGEQGQSSDFSQEMLAVRGCHATAVSLVM